jgi:lysophospholipase L1-like esterase
MRLLFSALALLISYSSWCQISFPPESKILCLGDSRVEGSDTYDSYRYEFWRDLIDCNWDFDLVGTEIDPISYPSYQNNNFDANHQGIGGYTTYDVLFELPNVLSTIGTVDIVLLGIGGNDALNEGSSSIPNAIENINSIIELIQSNNPQVLILIEQIAPGLNSMMTSDLTQALTMFNNDIEVLASNLTTPSSNIIAVDMSYEWQDAYLADDVHYNSIGAEVVATRYSNALKTIYNCNTENSIQEVQHERSLINTFDILGKEVHHTNNQIILHIYDDGSVEKKFIID